jgi:hypothetical protein
VALAVQVLHQAYLALALHTLVVAVVEPMLEHQALAALAVAVKRTQAEQSVVMALQI